MEECHENKLPRMALPTTTTPARVRRGIPTIQAGRGAAEGQGREGGPRVREGRCRGGGGFLGWPCPSAPGAALYLLESGHGVLDLSGKELLIVEAVVAGAALCQGEQRGPR